MPTYTATWPGVSSLSNFSCAFGPGIRPSTFVLNTHISAVDLNTLPQYGNLSILYNAGGGPAPVLTLTNCLLESPNIPQSKITNIQLPIKDRRWKWRFGMIRGNYNVRQPNGGYVRRRTPQELATLCLEAMGETGFDISRLPNFAYLPRTWIAENPARELDKICRELGCVVVLNPATDKVELWPVGTSRNPDPLQDTSYQITDGDGVTVAAKPKEVAVYGGESLYQSVFHLGEPVGRDIDGLIKPIDLLSYTPPGGWANEDANLFSFQFDDTKYTDPFSGEEKMVRDLALGSVWRMYRIGELVTGGYQPLLLAGDATFGPQFLKDLDLKQHRLDKYSGSNGEEIRMPARVIGRRYLDTLNAEQENNYAQLDAGFSISNEEGIVTFSESVYRYNDAGQVVAADGFLECAFAAGRDGNKSRYRRAEEVDPNGGGERPIIHRELVRESIERFAFDPVQGAVPVDITDNVLELHAQADTFIEGAVNEYQPKVSRTMSKAGVHVVSPDGNIVQVSWGKSAGGTTTTISSARQHNPYVPTVEDQRREQAAQENIDKQRDIDDVIAGVLA